MKYTFFLGANSRRGFVSFFEDVCTEQPGREVFMIKSGPGCGKSTMIQKVGDALVGDGAREDILCSSDPNSYDGVILHARGCAILDGTAPHVLEPAMPGANGGYLAFPPFLDRLALREKAGALYALAAAARDHYAQATRLIAAACEVRDSIRLSVEPLFDRHRFARRAFGIIARELPHTEGRGRVFRRFLDGITPDGCIRLWDTAATLCSRIYELTDSYGFSHLLLEPILHAAIERGHDVYACYDPCEPTRLLHLLLPSLSLGFVTTSQERCPLPVYRHIRADAYVSLSGERRLRGRTRLLTRIADSLMDDAVAEVQSAHLLHDRIEAIYRPHIDFAALDRRRLEIIDELCE